MISGVESEVHRALDSTKNSIIGVDKAKEAVNELKGKSNIIVDKNKEVIVAFDDLVTSIKSVKGILSGVSELSEHTNLLSLNAYIESAKAGENRKGFEVVASQISKLTDSTVSLTNDIYKIILSLENNTIKARNVIGDVLDMVDNENIVIDKAVCGFDTIGNNIIDLSQGISSIYERIGEVVDYSSKIEEQATKISNFSNIIENQTLEVLELNKDNQEKTKKTQLSMNDLVNVVEELDEYI